MNERHTEQGLGLWVRDRFTEEDEMVLLSW